MSLDGSQHLSLDLPVDNALGDEEEDKDETAALLDDFGGDNTNPMEHAQQQEGVGYFKSSNMSSMQQHNVSQNQLDMSQNFSFDPSLFDFNTNWTDGGLYTTTNNTAAPASHLKHRSSMGECSDGSLFDGTYNNINNNTGVSQAAAAANEFLPDNMMFARPGDGGDNMAQRLAANHAGATHTISVSNSSNNRSNTRHTSGSGGNTNRSTTATSVETGVSSYRALDFSANAGAALPKDPVSGIMSNVPTSAAVAAMASFFATTTAQQQQSSGAAGANMYFDPSLLPLAIHAVAAMGAGTLYHQQQHQQAIATTAASTMQPPNFPVVAAPPIPFTAPPPFTTATPAAGVATTATTSTHAAAAATAVPSTSQRQQQQPQADLPPFLLFDAPIELRANFEAAQRALGLPTMQDNNSMHYGLAGTAAATLPSPPLYSAVPQQQQQPQHHQQHHHLHHHVRLIDGRHGNVRNKRVKNEREQKRTQKITDLIDHLRDKMEHGGWRVGLKSKFHTLVS